MSEARVNEQGVLVVGPELTVAFAAQWRDALLDTMTTRSGNLHLDLAAVSEFDSSGLQLLLATSNSLAARGHALVITAAAAAVRDALTVFGLQALLSDTATPTAGD